MSYELPETIAHERETEPQPDDSPSSRLRRRMLSGEPFMYRDLTDERHSDALCSMTLRILRSLGFAFDVETVEVGERANGGTIKARRYTCTNPERSVAAMMRSYTASKKPSTEVAVVAEEPARPEPTHPRPTHPEPEPQLPLDDELVPLPHVDSQLTVYLAMRERDGTTRIGLRNGSQSWLLTIDAHAVEAGS